MDQEEGSSAWLTTIIVFCLILAFVAFIYKEMPDFLTSLTSKVEELKMEILLKNFG
jgi:uncharacterized membrane protein YqhA